MFALRTGSEPNPRSVVDDFEPAYLRVYRSGGLDERRRRGHVDIDRQPLVAEMNGARAAARRAGLSRIDRRW